MADYKNTPKPKPSAKPSAPKVVAPKVDAEAPKIYDAILEPAEVEVAATPAYTEKVEVDSVILPDALAAIAVPPTTYAVVSNDSVDTVHASKIIVHNKAQKKSLSVHHLQRRLNEWGFTSAYLDKDGYCGDNTVLAIIEFQKRVGIFPATGAPDYETLERIFEGDTNVKLVP